ncbi:hypothetical protein B0A49_07243 [Cryomyces minteri]|uniref:Quinate/shikimate 5-dehydrogenase/glutamyl-tRNA reductase domain-containing protein n=1 Tax=Cryomyces minteri TaxID=331657 RepID=A0A4U0XB63_9PEZI|nr:hypothetical protein B0A49_07243 [Cryomyces minteri]
MPHKLAINKYCTSTSIHAQRIGAVNTLIVHSSTSTQLRPAERKQILGDNTDWSGLASIIQQHNASSPTPAKTSLVIGVGSATRAVVYVMYQSGLTTIYLYNRTLSRASKIASAFSSLFTITVLDSLSDVPSTSSPDIIMARSPRTARPLRFPLRRCSRNRRARTSTWRRSRGRRRCWAWRRGTRVRRR